MRLTLAFALTLALAALAGCSSASNDQAPPQSASAPATDAQNRAGGATAEGADVSMKTVSLQQADDATAAPSANAPAAERRIIRNASLTLEVEQPTKAMQAIASIAESRGGFVVTSDSVRHVGTKGSKSYEVVTVEIRVPAAQFDAALAEIRGAAGSVTAQKITGKDVTEEYIDLEARLRTQKALEAQLMEIMKRAQEVEDAVTVQRELTNVRTEIERVEGRRRFLENQSSLSTISVTLQPPAPLIGTTGFFQGVGSAFGEGVDLAAAITLFLIRLLLALLPIALFIGLPAYFILRYLIRRARLRPAPPPHVQEFQPQPPPHA
jgi:Domain of unknown function (DUF4349)